MQKVMESQGIYRADKSTNAEYTTSRDTNRHQRKRKSNRLIQFYLLISFTADLHWPCEAYNTLNSHSESYVMVSVIEAPFNSTMQLILTSGLLW